MLQQEELLRVENLVTQFKTANGSLSAVHGVSFSVKKGETLCIVGESGCGKSITALSIMRLLPNNGNITSGEINFDGKDLATLTDETMRKVRGNDISMIFQEPMTALNPVFTIGYQLREPLLIHNSLSKKQASQKAIELLNQVGMPLPEKHLNQYPHELSGGMRQRIMIAMALACHPKLLIADEPTTALDVTIQAQILDLINDLKTKFDTGVVMITHDMGVVAEIADRVMVMYAGEVAEQGSVEKIFNNPQHPYTKGLLNSVPNVDDDEFTIEAIPGTLPKLDDKITGCRFHPRCKFVMDKCKVEVPKTFTVSEGHKTRCWLQEEVDAGHEYNKTTVPNS
jgi:oligopeptide/dipeptide ABC transporter ATP-binding protein